MAKKPAKKPAKPVAKKAAKPAAKKPAAKPAKASKPVAKPKAKAKPAAKPAAKKSAAKPAPKKPVAKAAAKPVAKAPVKAAKPAQKPAAKPQPKAAVKPAVKTETAPKPAPVAAKPSAKPAPVATPKPVKKESKKEAKEPKAPAQPLVTQVSAPMRPVAPPVVKKQVSTLESADKARYSDDELDEFKEIIMHKLDEARRDYDLLKQTLANTDNNGTDDTSPSFKMIEDGSETLSREETAQLAGRQEKFIKHLEDALLRIRNKTYGICRVTGRLISKERLRLVPHATLSIEAKQQMGN
jgi:RNA polymerase-binding transcription factor DksA